MISRNCVQWKETKKNVQKEKKFFQQFLKNKKFKNKKFKFKNKKREKKEEEKM